MNWLTDNHFMGIGSIEEYTFIWRESLDCFAFAIAADSCAHLLQC